MTAKRIDPEQAHQAVEAGALLVCAYDDDEKCRQNLLEGAIPLSQFLSLEPSLPRNQRVIFYCA